MDDESKVEETRTKITMNDLECCDCDKNEAVGRCEICWLRFCSDCFENHEKMKHHYSLVPFVKFQPHLSPSEEKDSFWPSWFSWPSWWSWWSFLTNQL